MNKTIGWHFPVTFNKYSQSVETSTGRQSIKESLSILLSTTCGERLMELEYGCNLNKLVFSTLNLNDITCLTNDIEKVIEKWEKRISISDVRVKTETEDEGVLCITIEYTIKGLNEADSFNLKYNLENG